jgi:hypothetical protein
MPNPITAPLVAYATRLRFPVLFGITLSLWAITMILPDPIPLLDEIVMGLLALVLATWKKRTPAEPAAPPVREGVTLEGESRRE